MYAYKLEIELQDFVYYASRELGRYYISEQYLHNYALTYALGLATSTYHDAVQIPHYKEDLEQLNEAGVYVTPAKPLKVTTSSHTFKFADTRYQVKMEQSSINMPTFGRLRELTPQSTFEAFVFSQSELKIPNWIRLGKWLSKASVYSQKLELKESKKSFSTLHPLNPLDNPLQPQIYDLINMPPVSLINNARFEGECYTLELSKKDKRYFPKGLRYTF